jgi:hypothetical protein
MWPNYYKRSGKDKRKNDTPPSAIRQLLRINTHSDTSVIQEFIYLDDVKTMININTLEERIALKKWLIKQLQASKSKEELIQLLFDSEEKDRHRLQKEFKISV